MGEGDLALAMVASGTARGKSNRVPVPPPLLLTLLLLLLRSAATAAATAAQAGRAGRPGGGRPRQGLARPLGPGEVDLAPATLMLTSPRTWSRRPVCRRSTAAEVDTEAGPAATATVLRCSRAVGEILVAAVLLPVVLPGGGMARWRRVQSGCPPACWMA